LIEFDISKHAKSGIIPYTEKEIVCTGTGYHLDEKRVK